MYVCLECGRKFKTTAAAERAADRGCPKCGGVDVDLDNRPKPTTKPVDGTVGPKSLSNLFRM
jgi:predicted  nucleic acid-binding Zn-ribbon protein